jgi:hypothetical protein
MYDTLYCLIKYIKNDYYYKSICSFSDCIKTNMRSQLILLTFDKDDINNYFNGDSMPDDYFIKEYPVDNYKKLYKHEDIYIFFNNDFKNNLENDGDINIVNIIFGYGKMINYIKKHRLFLSLKCNLKKEDKFVHNYHITQINLQITNFIYRIDCNVYSKLKDCPRLLFLTLNNIKIPFPDETEEDFEERRLFNEKCKNEIKLMNQIEQEIIMKRSERVNNFLELSDDIQEKIINKYS